MAEEENGQPGPGAVLGAALGLGPNFDPFAPGTWDFHKLGLTVNLPDNPLPEKVNVYVLVWKDKNGLHACNFIGEETMREFIKAVRSKMAGIVTPPGVV